MPLVPIDQIHEPEDRVRRTRPSPASDAALKASIAARRILVPILVRPNGNGFVLKDGARRLRVARELGMTTVPVHIADDTAAQHDALDEAAVNLVRADLAPLDQWRAIVRLQAEGYTLNHAGACLGLSERAAKRLDKLGRLHPDLLALIEAHGLPEEDELATIALAPLEVQAKAAQSHAKHVAAVDDEGDVDWHHIANACACRTISRRHAIFDVDVEAVVFEEDLFAQPDEEDAVFTRDVAGFLDAQQRALAVQVAADKANKRRVELAAHKGGRLVLPKGFADSYGNPEKPKKTETVFLAVARNSYYTGRIVRAVAVKSDAKHAPEPDAPASDHDDDDEDAVPTARARPAPAASPEAEAESRDPISPAGRDEIARRKTQALRATLTDNATTFSPAKLLAFLVLALGARTVRISNGTAYGQIDLRDLAARIVTPDGAALDLQQIESVAAEALSRILLVPLAKDAPDAAVEWIGHVARAADALPRFDTPEFLAHVNGAELKRLAAEAGLKPAKTAAGLREQLAGKLPDWRPATFGAPGPKESADG